MQDLVSKYDKHPELYYIKRNHQKGWKVKKEHHQRIKQAKEWLGNQLLDDIGGGLVETRVAEFVVDIVNVTVEKA